MSILIQCSKHVRTAYTLTRHRISNTLISNSNSQISQRTLSEHSNGAIPRCNTNILPNRSFFSSTIHCSTANKVDNCIKQLDSDLRRYGRITKQEIEEIINEINTSKIATPTQSLMVLRCCGNLVPDELPANRTELAQKIWQTINAIGVPLDISHYNTLLKVYLENDYQFSQTEFLENLEKQGIVPNRVTYQHLISSYCQNGDIAGASRILEYMRGKQLPINKIVFNSLIMGHSQNGDMESAEGILNVMKESNLEPSSDTYTLLASGYAKKGDVGKINDILDVCQNNEIYLSNKEYLDIIYTLAINGKGEFIDQIIEKIPKTTGYNQDAINCIYKLVTSHQEEAAFKIFDTMTKPLKSDGTSPPIGRFLIAHLTKVNSSLDKILGFCNKLVTEETNPKAFEIATEMALRNGSVDIALGMFQYMKENEQPIRQHYFWPILVSKNKQNDVEGLKDVLSIMVNEYKLSLNIDTLRFYVLPTMMLNQLNGAQVINELQVLGIPSGTTTHALVLYLLAEKNIRDAADIAATKRAFFLPSLIRRPLVNAFLATNDVTSLIVLLQQICNGLSRYNLVISPELAKKDNYSATPTSEEQIVELREFFGQVISDIVRYSKLNPGVTQLTQELLENMYGKGLGINSWASEQIQNHLQGKLTFEVSSLLENLTDTNLVPKTELSVKPSGYILSNVSESSLEKIIQKAELSGESKNSSKRQLLNLYCKNKNIDKATELKNKLMAEGFNIPVGSMVLLLDLYVTHDKLAEAQEIFQQLKTTDPEFVLDKYKVIKMAESIAKNSIEGAIDFVSSIKKFDDNSEFTSFQHANMCWKLLNTIAESGNIESVQKMFELMINNNFITVSNILLGPLIKVHLINNDIKGALDKFEWCCKTYRCTPWKNELALKFIESEDATSLQVLTDLSTTIHGEVNSLYDLMLAFIDSGRVKQARKILETPGLRIRQDRINAACAKYGSENAKENLINLLEVTKGIISFDRTKIFNELLQLYIKDNDVEKSMALWTQIQEEDIQPSDHFLWSLKELLTKNNLNVPFTVRKPSENINHSSIPSNASSNLSNQLISCIESKNVTKALSLRQAIHSKGLHINSMVESQIIELLTKEDKLSEAFDIVKSMLENGRPITKNIMNFFAGKLSDAGEITKLEYLNKKMSKGFVNKLNLNSKMFKAYQNKGNHNDLLNSIEASIDENISNPDKLSEIIKKVPGGNLVKFLNLDLLCLPIIERLHGKVSAHGYSVFSNALWSYFMLNKEFDKAINIAKDMENVKFVQYRQLLSDIRLNNNIELGFKLLEILPSFKQINQNSNLGIVYSAMIDSYVSKNMLVDANNLLNKALEKIALNDINETAILRLKSNCEAQGIPFNYDTSLFKKRISKNPELHSDSSDSSDSDNEKVAKV